MRYITLTPSATPLKPILGRQMMLKQRGHWGISTVGSAPDLHSGGQRFEPAILHEFFILTMSLISQKDREMAIEALEYYVEQLKRDNCTQASISAFQTLLNWIELEHFKHEN